MNAYELIRQGEIIGLLTPEEINDFVNEGIAEKDLTEATERTADADELYYLETMRKIIDGCGKPYFARAGVFSEIQADLQKKRGTPTYPLVAARLLLPNIEAGHKAQARDRAYCEAWSLALALACGNETPPPGVNPLSGKEYRCSKKDGRVEVRGIELNESDETPIVIPLPK
jgi:hypothetical protein